MRTLIAPLDPGVESQLRGLDRKRAEIARRYIRRLALEPHLGYRLARGRLAQSSAAPSALTTITGPRSCSARATAHRAAAMRIPARPARGGGSCTGRPKPPIGSCG